ncbi:hypothetical protein B0T21DRAFT_367706 [Apiosordaria backusii]|uniref:Uncharacterized protein n=1 Tax=Apiosordaria backusii TaxID=314023 RepID=A0AA40BJS0_9PEZI|nr:hypothetical protein B0T21DRAFT_367706 [Apiosordaria backusii]
MCEPHRPQRLTRRPALTTSNDTMELSKSRHAPWNRGQTTPSPLYSRNYLSVPLTVKPAPTGDATPSATNIIYLSDNNNTNNLLHLNPPTRLHPPASSSQAPNPQQSAALRAALELSRYRKILRRLQWKSQFLDNGYQLAIHRLGQDPHQVAERELMFKLDFFEYYMLIERAVVHLLAVFGVDIDRHTPSTSGPPSRSASPVKQGQGQERGLGLTGSRWGSMRDNGNKYRHRYHANVLEALDKPDNPLNGILGQGEVRKQLGRAKDLRNRWKTAGEEIDDGGILNGQQQRRWVPTKKIPAPLETYDLSNMLRAISDGFAEAGQLAEEYVMGFEAVMEGGAGGGDMVMTDENGEPLVDWGAAIRNEEMQWDFMVDAMDWEAV